MANSFSSSIGSHRASALQGAMQAMSGGSFSSLPSTQSGLDNRQRAIEKASAWSDRGLSAFGGMGDSMNNMAANAASASLQLKASDAVHEANMDAARAAQDAQNQSGLFSTIAQGVSIGAMLLCERRLKTNIHSLDGDRAWAVVRELPLYGFNYKAMPGPTVYGPMIDEVEPLDTSLVRPSLLPPDEDGEVRGFDVVRHKAYESVALQQALHRIEALEADLGKLQDAVSRLLLQSTPSLAVAA